MNCAPCCAARPVLTRSVKPLQGAAMLALSALLFSLMGVAIREVSVSVNNESVVFFRNLVGVVFFLPLVLIKGFQPLRTQRLKSHLWRTTYGLAAMYCFFYAIAHLPLADAMLLSAGFVDADAAPGIPGPPAGAQGVPMPSNTSPNFPPNPDVGLTEGIETGAVQ